MQNLIADPFVKLKNTGFLFQRLETESQRICLVQHDKGCV